MKQIYNIYFKLLLFPSFFYFCTFLKKDAKNVTLTLRTGDQTTVDLKIATAHSKSPLLDELEIIAEALAFLLKDKEDFTNSEKRKLSHVRNMTRHHSPRKD